ncbi:MAG: hypothetical protein CO064_00025, partial [Anaerolineae bacterium CG_4_9_14_0_8_um_filter_58_9]
MDSPKEWHAQRLDVSKILEFRSSLINSHRKNLVDATRPDKFLQT